MKLDYRIIDGKKPLDCYDADIAENFIGKKGYFSNSLGWYSVLKSTWDGTLDKIESEEEQCFYDGESEGYFHYFLPAEWVKEVKYRPFTPDEFTDTFTIGEPIIFRRKQSKRLYEYNVLFIGCCFSGDNTDVVLGNDRFSLETLFNNYEWRQHGSYEWKTFGIKE